MVFPAIKSFRPITFIKYIVQVNTLFKPKDELMTWDPVNYDNITVMRVFNTQIWNPGNG